MAVPLKVLISRPVKYASCAAAVILAILLLIFMISTGCNKNINAQANKSYLSVTNAAPGAPPVDVYFENNILTTSGQLGYCVTTGVPGQPYDTATAGVHPFRISSGTTNFADGNIAFGLNKYYSVFVYDTLSNNTLKTVVLQDGLISTAADTLCAARYLNLSPDTTLFEIVLTNQVDTVFLPFSPFIGSNPDPNSLDPFQTTLVQGSYGVLALVDSTNHIPLDSVTFTGGKCYTIYVTGFYNQTGPAGLGIHLLQHN
jgi:hypothetical protein